MQRNGLDHLSLKREEEAQKESTVCLRVVWQVCREWWGGWWWGREESGEYWLRLLGCMFSPCNIQSFIWTIAWESTRKTMRLGELRVREVRTSTPESLPSRVIFVDFLFFQMCSTQQILQVCNATQIYFYFLYPRSTLIINQAGKWLAGLRGLWEPLFGNTRRGVGHTCVVELTAVVDRWWINGCRGTVATVPLHANQSFRTGKT